MAGQWQRIWLACNASLSVGLAVALLLLRRSSSKNGTAVANAPASPGRKGKKDLPLPSVDQTLALLKARRSIFPKDFDGAGHSVTDEEIRLLLEGANWAPTHKRTEPWRFVVFRGKEIEKVLTATEAGNKAASEEQRGETFESWYADWQQSVAKKWSKCDVLIALNMLRQAKPDQPPLPEWEEIGAVSCAVQNLHLMATALGLAGYWSSWNKTGRDSEAMAQLLGISREGGDRCLGFFVLGSSGLVGKMRSGRGPVSEKTRWVS